MKTIAPNTSPKISAPPDDLTGTHQKHIRILHIMPQIGIGGAENQLHDLIAHSDPNMATHQVLYYGDSHDLEGFKLYTRSGIHHQRVPRNKRNPLGFLLNFAAHIKKINPDIIHCWLVSGNLWGRTAAILAGSKNILVAYRNTELAFRNPLRLLERLTLSRVHHLANSRAVAQAVTSQLHLPPHKFNVVYNGIDTEKYNRPTNKKHLLETLNLPPQTKLITMVGTLMHRKNYPLFLNTARICKEKLPQAHFLAVGHGHLENELKTLAQKLNAQHIVHFLGLRRDIPQILAASDLFCFTTSFEGFPNALLEAMTAARPIVTTNFDGVDELIQNNVNGLIVPLNNPESAAHAVQNLIANPDLAQKLAHNARQTVLQKFSLQNMVQNTHNLYKKMLNHNIS